MTRFGRLAVPALLLVTLTACTRRGGEQRTTPTAQRTSAAPTQAVPTSVAPGTGVYVYQNAGLTATLELDAGSGTLQIKNDTGRDLAAPGFYLLDARDGRRVPGTVEQPAPTPDGRTSDFDVRVSGLEVRNIGLAVLLIGHDNYGAFVRQ